MSHRADPRFLTELSRYGAVNIESCFNCGNCSAVCPLSSGSESFPRRMIRYAQLGMQDRLLGSKELWMCYYCGQCTSTCPRKADPGEFMAAARRYAIAKYDRLGLARLLYTSATFNVLFLIGLAAVLSVFLYSFHGPMPTDALRLFEFIPSQVIHDLGVTGGIIVSAIALSGLLTMAVRVGKEAKFHERKRLGWIAAFGETMSEVLGQRRYRKDCEAYTQERHWYSQQWLIPASIVWGFLGLFLATAVDYLLELLDVKATGTWVPLWYPVRLLGTVAGLLMMYGTTAAIVKRLRKSDEASTYSTTSDWAFLILLWLGGMTGFTLEASLYLPQPHAWGYWLLLAHLVVVGELLILWPFTKFAHAIYRPVALYTHVLQPLREGEPPGAEAAD